MLTTKNLSTKKLLTRFLRGLLIYLTIGLCSYWFFSFYKKTFHTPHQISVWQGYTSQTQTQLSVLTSSKKKLSYFLKSKKQILPIKQISKDGWVIEHLVIHQLQPKTSYHLIIKDNKGTILSKKKFKTLDLNQQSLTFAVASCMDDGWNQKVQKKMWKDLLSFKPDMIFLIGDNVYADKYIKDHSEKNFFQRYTDTITKLHLYQSNHLIPILAIWDDHDYGKNNGDKYFALKPQMQKMFRQDFFPLFFDNKHLYKGKGVSFLLKTKYQNFLFMDDRSFRSANHESKGSLWGTAQAQWLYRHLSTKTPSWIINGGQIFGKHHSFESFEGNFPIDFKKVIRRIVASESPVIFLSGDRHLAELQKVNDYSYPLHELTTSGIHAKTNRGEVAVLDSDRYVHQKAGQLNYAIIRSKGAFQKGLIVNAKIYSQNKKILFEENIMVHK